MRALYGDLLLQRMDQQADRQLYRKLYHAIRCSILDGILTPLSRLPSTRELAAQLGISRNTVLVAYEQLTAEGYIVTQTGSGTRVAENTPESYLTTNISTPVSIVAGREAPLSQRGASLLGQINVSAEQWGLFLPGVPDVRLFPFDIFRKIRTRLSRMGEHTWASYSPPGGSLVLRQALATHLRIARAVRCEPEQILLTDGVHQALDLVTRLLTDPGDRVWLEEPCYWGIRHILQMNGLTLTGCAVDDAGMTLPAVVRSKQRPRLIFVTPSHQYPLGPVMSLARRQQLLALARHHDAWIIEDDYDSEFRFSGHPIPSLQGLEENAPVIYVGTFSKTLYPGLRFGYMVLPIALAQAFQRAHSALYRAGRLLTQETIAEFIHEGYYSAHIRRMRLLYGKRRACLAGLITQYFGKAALGALNHNAGLHLVLNLPNEMDDVTLARSLNQQGIWVRPLSLYYQYQTVQKGLLIGFANVPEEQMPAAFAVLRTYIPTW